MTQQPGLGQIEQEFDNTPIRQGIRIHHHAAAMARGFVERDGGINSPGRTGNGGNGWQAHDSNSDILKVTWLTAPSPKAGIKTENTVVPWVVL